MSLFSRSLSLPSSTAIMAVVDPTIPDWIPTVDMKCDGKQLTFSVPAALLPITRQILYRRYVGDIGKRDGYQVIWVDQTKANKDLQVSDSDLTDLNNIPSTLRSDLFKSRTQVSAGTTKVVTITAYYSTGTILVQGTKCLAWVKEEFDALIATARAIYALKTTNSSVDTNKEVEEGLRLLRPPSADRDGSEEASAPVCPPFIGALLRCIRSSSSTPTVTDCGSPAVAATATVTSLSPSPTPAARPSGGEAMYPALCGPPTNGPAVNGQQPATTTEIGATQGDHKQAKCTPFSSHSHHYKKSKFLATRFRLNKGQSFTTKQAIKLRTLTRKVHTLTAAFSEASRVMHKLQQQTHTLTVENQTLKSVIRDMQNHLTSPSTTTQNNTSASQVPVTDKSPTVQNSSKSLRTTNGKRTSTGSTGQQRARTSAPPPKPAVCSSATPTRQGTMQDTRPAATSGHADSTSPVTATSPRQRLAELRVAPGVTNVLIGDSVARPIKPDLVFPGGQSQNLSVSGLAIDDVNHWLANIPRNREVRRAVIHIGVNTCKFAVVTESMWRQLIRKLKHVFPEAAVLVSSIVPPMGRLRKTVQVSNAALLAVCNREKVSFINHTDAFTARSGAPRKHLYRDQLHPSDGGTSRLVFNLQLATGARRRQAQHHLPSSRPHHRQDPAQPQQRQEGIKQHHAARPSLLGPVPPGFVPRAQHHWLTYLNSRQWQRTTAPQQCEAGLYRPAYGVRHNTAVNSPRPPTPPVYYHCVPRDLYPRETLV